MIVENRDVGVVKVIPPACKGCVNIHANQWGYMCRIFTEFQPKAFKKPNGKCSAWRDKNGEIWLRYLLSRYEASHKGSWF